MIGEAFLHENAGYRFTSFLYPLLFRNVYTIRSTIANKPTLQLLGEDVQVSRPTDMRTTDRKPPHSLLAYYSPLAASRKDFLSYIAGDRQLVSFRFRMNDPTAISELNAVLGISKALERSAVDPAYDFEAEFGVSPQEAATICREIMDKHTALFKKTHGDFDEQNAYFDLYDELDVLGKIEAKFSPLNRVDSLGGEQEIVLSEVAKNKDTATMLSYLMNHTISDTERKEIAGVLLGYELSQKQKDTLLDAHNKPGEIDNLTEGQKTVKGLALMRNGVFSRDEAQLLLDAGLCGSWLGKLWPFGSGGTSDSGVATIDSRDEAENFFNRNASEMEADSDPWATERTENDEAEVKKNREFTEAFRVGKNPLPYLKTHPDAEPYRLRAAIINSLNIFICDGPIADVIETIEILRSKKEVGIGPKGSLQEALQQEMQAAIFNLLSSDKLGYTTTNLQKAIELQQRYGIPLTGEMRELAVGSLMSGRIDQDLPAKLGDFLRVFDIPKSVLLKHAEKSEKTVLVAGDILRERGFKNESREMKSLAKKVVTLNVSKGNWEIAKQSKTEFGLQDSDYEAAVREGLVKLTWNMKLPFNSFIEGERELGISVDRSDATLRGNLAFRLGRNVKKITIEEVPSEIAEIYAFSEQFRSVGATA